MAVDMPAGGDRETELTHALAAVRSRLAAAAEAAGRNVGEIELLPITKFFPATDVVTLSRLGCRAVGESRDQEASEKVSEVTKLLSRVDVPAMRWHMVGHIQRNKARSVARWAHTAHSVDSSQLVSALDRGVSAALAEGRRADPMRIYVQISLDGDESRGGVDISLPGAVDQLCAQAEESKHLELAGLMAIPPLGSDPDAAFGRLRTEHLRVLESHPNAVGLSAGMSDDFEIAVKHGSTCVRVGTALLGPRPLPSPY
ncbi:MULTISPECIES: YggS family pyridoxal phosphate-dependent enzyme [unclassified Mycobacterium]|uniref:YggS family pyridoxal phosphate-dependent enzyme n=1 Tax=unclassified Mycobacterium TaxID=2642494 RepID=UPI0007FEB91F|nr:MULTISPECIES: YggS family pyridoxal phosphate-dependent enzyme [unclassified Mycobacterium]OBG58912.1 YggS family pyridoxal phosphate enzyme [Mycobacterium sp. E188]OBG68372.1 YggS family pyridoxal phosphate enzyme [Mycobacterium sp. E735]OBG71857.1 YggS family pyridoxal phosphate enzyme [Mycobacterium sp. E3305]OBG78262.1 YggS family pyridoxal phosphate enzyme [Mycobacterium sp. E3298]OBH30621.1 YggS family pyridoxal phosphate enzyme [Mycobacterium sp. E1715]